MKPLVIYHANCWDGFCAAWIAKRALGDCDFHPAHYGNNPPKTEGREVYILDFSYPRNTLLSIYYDAKSLLVLDHHHTAKQDLERLEFCKFDMNKSGGRLAWEHFGFIGGWKGMQSPWLVDYTEDRDMWWHKQFASEYVNAALRSYPLNFDLWDSFDNSETLDKFVIEGTAIRRAEKQIVDSHIRNAREIELDGYKIKAVNATVLFSEIAGELANERPFGACYFDRKDGKRQWSLRSRENGIDVSVIAKNHGGGGHKQAAGYEEKL